MSIRVQIVIPLYMSPLPLLEEQAVRNNIKILNNYPVSFVVPRGYDSEYLQYLSPTAGIVEVTDEWLGRKNGIAGYNRMMMSKSFYEIFSDCEYILICQPDVWVFRDELVSWCEQGYDYVGAPWVRPPKYDGFRSKVYLLAQRLLHPTRAIHRTDILGRVGNGGLSLRRVISHINACERYITDIERFLQGDCSFYNEDVFWAMIPQEFRYPMQEEALRFSMDENPDVAYSMNSNKLPMGCHGFCKAEYWPFWSSFIAPE